MILKCTNNRITDFKNQIDIFEILKKNYSPIDWPIGIGIGCFFKVYAIKQGSLLNRVFIADQNPLIIDSYHDIFFEIIDSRISRYWDKNFQGMSYEEIKSLPKGTEASFKEWINDPNFYYKLIEGEEVPGVFTDKESKDALKIFQRYKDLMDLEFAMPGIKEKAIDLGSDNWLMCTKCDESWQDENAKIHEMVKCPKCVTVWLSPLNQP